MPPGSAAARARRSYAAKEQRVAHMTRERMVPANNAAESSTLCYGTTMNLMSYTCNNVVNAATQK